MYPDIKLRLILVSKVGRVGIRTVGNHEAMVWTEEDDDPTSSATFVEVTSEGAEVTAHQISGDQWRDFEDNKGDAGWILKFMQLGYTLHESVEWVVFSNTPTDWSGPVFDMARELAEARAEAEYMPCLVAAIFRSDSLRIGCSHSWKGRRHRRNRAKLLPDTFANCR